MPLSPHEKSILAELGKKKNDSEEQARLKFEFAGISESVRVARWKDIVERTKTVVSMTGSNSRPYDGHYNTRTEGHDLAVTEENGLMTTVSFHISHEQSPEIYGFDCSGVRWLTVNRKLKLSTDPEAQTDRGSQTLGPNDCVKYPDDLETNRSIGEYVQDLEAAEAALGIARIDS